MNAPAQPEQPGQVPTYGTVPGDGWAAPETEADHPLRALPPAEAQQDDERERVVGALIDADGAYTVRDMDGPGYFEVLADAVLAARPPADTETLRKLRAMFRAWDEVAQVSDSSKLGLIRDLIREDR